VTEKTNPTKSEYIIKRKSGKIISKYKISNKKLGGKVYIVSKKVSDSMPSKKTTFVERNPIKHCSIRLKSIFNIGD